MKLEQTDLFGLFGMEDEAVETVNVLDEVQPIENAVNEVAATKEVSETTDIKTKDDKTPIDAGTTQSKSIKLSAFEDDEKDKEKEKAAQAKKPKTPAKPKTGDVFELTPHTVINHAGQEVPITRYFTIEEIENGIDKKQKEKVVKTKIDEKDLIKKLNQDFAELMPQLTTLVYFKKENRVIPVQRAEKKGLGSENQESSSEGSFSSPKRIPFRLLNDFISIAREFSINFQSEIHADIYFDFEQDDFFMDFPEQIVHPLWVKVTEDFSATALKLLNKKAIKVMEIHSHHRMAPIPSETDNAGERLPNRFYAIVGNIDSFFPDITVRAFDIHKQKHIPLKLEKVFESPILNNNNHYDLSYVEVAKK